MQNRPSIPAEITRQILTESGHRCAVCGANCPLERAHIVPWHRSKQHKAEDLICLCASCHERADLEQWGEATLREYKARPWVHRQSGFVTRTAFENALGQESWRPRAPRMVRIHPGRFMMGSPVYEQGRRDETEHEVSISHTFEMFIMPVTQMWWQDVMDNNPSQFKGYDHPIERVNWYDAVVFCNQLSAKCELPAAYVIGDMEGTPGLADFKANVTWRVDSVGFRLPTEAEWEYACRAGTTGPTYSGYPFEFGAIAWIQSNSQSGTHPVGGKEPNAWGLHDMLGNVHEWVWDWYDHYPEGPAVNPTGPSTPKANPSTGSCEKVHRGGAWHCIEWRARCAERHTQPPGFREGHREGGLGDSIGFRLARSV
jgi:sulfatase modifying factor 1